jgi:hypothetical protein
MRFGVDGLAVKCKRCREKSYKLTFEGVYPTGAFSVRIELLRSDTSRVARGKGCEFFAGFGYALGEHPACSIGGDSTI